MNTIIFLIVSILVIFNSRASAAVITGSANFDGGSQIQIRQEDTNGSVMVTGLITGWGEGAYELRLVALSVGGCEDVSQTGKLLGVLAQWDQTWDEDVKIENEANTPVILAVDDVTGVVIRTCIVGEAGLDCDMGDDLACEPLLLTEETGAGMYGSLEFWIIIGVVIIVFFLLLICIPLICCCARRRPKHSSGCGMDSGIDDEYPDRKSPMYDEISLPFIDASLPPTPKIGRVVNGLDILLGRENSQVDNNSQVQW